MILSHIVAISKNRVIGKDNSLPWHIPEDLKFFREKTINHVMIMGRKTFDSLKSPLPKRHHIVITRSTDNEHSIPQVDFVNSLDKAIERAEKLTQYWGEEVFIIGGGDIFKQSLTKIHRIYLTLIDQNFEGQIYYPEFPENLFQLIEEKKVQGDIPFSFQTWEKIK